jgi:hypothetical protein
MNDPFTTITAPGLFTTANWAAAAAQPNGSLVQLQDLLTPAGTLAASGSEQTLFGGTISATIAMTPHSWVAGSDGLFYTPTDLSQEWATYYQQALAGTALTPLQHLEASAEAVFLNTKLNTLDPAVQERDREDVQREFDAIAVAMDRAGLSNVKQLTVNDYLAISYQIRADPVLQELAIQGHGLNSPPSAKYNGYTQDFQNNVDRTTLFIGGGLDNNQNALTDFFDDVVISHEPFPTVPEWNGLEQLNQNANNEDYVATATSGFNDAMFNRVYTAKDFSQTPGKASSTVAPPPTAPVPYGPTQMLGYYNTPVDRTITIANADLGAGISHTWQADGSGRYVLTGSTDLASEWLADYRVLTGGTAAQQAALTNVQRLEGNIEGIFLNTSLRSLSAAQLATDRMDIQRQLDALSAAMVMAGVGPQAQFTASTYRATSLVLQGTPDLDELALQGHGLGGTGLARYNGYVNDIQWTQVDTRTLYVGPGFDSGTKAVTTLLNDLTLEPFAQVAQNGVLYQLDHDGMTGATLGATIDGVNAAMASLQYGQSAFSAPGFGSFTIGGMSLPATVTFSNALLGTGVSHTWTAVYGGLYVTTANLAAEWKQYYATMTAGKGASLTAIQRWEGNAEAVLEAVNLNSGDANYYRMDIQRLIDATSQAMTTLNLGSAPLSTAGYVALSNAIQDTPLLNEFAQQGEGLNSPVWSKYAGFVNQLQYNHNLNLYFVGGGTDNGKSAVTNFATDFIVGYLANPTYANGGTLRQLNQNNNDVGTVAQVAANLNQTLFDQVYLAADFSKSSTAKGPVMTIAGSVPGVAANPLPGASQIVTATGAVIDATIAGLPHGWGVDSKGVFQLAADLTLEWHNAYQQVLANPAGMSWNQRAEANAEALFEAAGINTLSEAQQAQYRADIQREIDAIWGAMGIAGLQAKTALSTQDYVTLGDTLRASPVLLELATQGRGLCGGWNTRESGYQNDFRWTHDGYLVSAGLPDDGQSAIGTVLNDLIGGDLIFGTSVVNGVPQVRGAGTDLDQTVSAAVATFNAGYRLVLTGANVFLPGGVPAPTVAAPAAGGTAQDGTALPASVTANGHVWTVDAAGLYHTGNLEIEWRSLYNELLTTGGTGMTPWQRLEANAEAVFQYTDVKYQSAAQIQRYREDVQRVIDAEAAAASAAGVNMTGPLSTASAIAIENVLHGTSVFDETLGELALQGAGQGNNSDHGGSARYNGYASDFRYSVGNSQYFVGGGADNGKSALAAFAGDVLINDLAFGTVLQNGKLYALDLNGNTAGTLSEQTTALNNLMYRQILVASDFSTNAKATGVVRLMTNAPASVTAAALPTTTNKANSVVTAQGAVIAATQTLNGHTWVAGSDGLFHTGDLSAEWLALYTAAKAGATLTSTQMLEANAEAVFLNTSIAGWDKAQGGAARTQSAREDVQRVIDALAQAETLAGVAAGTPLTANLVETLDKTMATNAVLNEFVAQGYGGAGSAQGSRYSGLQGDVYGADWSTRYTGGGFGNGDGATREFLRDAVLGDIGMPVFVTWNGVVSAQTTSPWQSLALSQAAAQLNLYGGTKVLGKTDFA